MFYQFNHLGSPDYLKVEYGENFSFPLHLHHCFEFVAVLSGEMQITVDKNEYILKEKHIYYTILVVKKGKQKLTDLQIKYGLNIHCANIELANYLKFLQDGYKKRLNMVNDLQKQELVTCINEIESIIKEGK